MTTFRNRVPAKSEVQTDLQIRLSSEVIAKVHEHILVHLLIEFSRIEGREAAGSVLINAEQQVWNECGWNKTGPVRNQAKIETMAYFAEIVALLNRATLYGSATSAFR